MRGSMCGAWYVERVRDIHGGIQAVREHRDLLSNMDLMRKDEAGNAVTAQSAIDTINLTAAAMESLYDSTTVAKTHVGLKG